MYITGMTIEGISPFTDQVEFKFDEQVNVFIGPNAVGKTALLLGLSKIPSGPPYRCVYYVGDFGRQELSASPDWPAEHGERADLDDGEPPAPKWDETPFVYVGATRLNLPEQADVYGDVDESQPVDPQIVQQSIFEPLVATGSYRIPNAFDAMVVRAAVAGQIPEGQLFDMAVEEGLGNIQQQFATANELGLQCAQYL